jgi:hypothetical protein
MSRKLDGVEDHGNPAGTSADDPGIQEEPDATERRATSLVEKYLLFNLQWIN